MPFLVRFRWQSVSSYLLSGATLAALWTTGRYLKVQPRRLWLGLGAALILLVTAFFLDPTTIWANLFETISLANQDVSQFDIWGALWGATLFLPIFAAWIMVQQALRQLPESISSNQLHFWKLALLLMFAGCIPALIRQPGQPFWQLSGAILFAFAAGLGTYALGNSHLPEIRQVYRRLGQLLLTVLPVLALTFGAIWLVVRTDLGAQLTANNIGLVITAAIVSLAVVFLSQIFAALLARLGQRAGGGQLSEPIALAWHDDMLDLLPLGQAILQTVQADLAVDDVWLALTDDGPAGRLMLRPLAHAAGDAPDVSSLAPESPLARQWRGNSRPLVNEDIFHLLDFQDMASQEKASVADWKRAVFAPLHAGQRLVGVLGIAPRGSQQPFSQPELNRLGAFAGQFGPLLAQARSLAALRQTNQFVFDQNQALVRDNRRLTEVSGLLGQSLALITPELREPVTSLDIKWQQLYPELPPSVDFGEGDMAEPIATLKQSLGNLLLVTNRVQKHSQFDFRTLKIAELCEQVVEQLDTMAQARRVSVNFMAEDGLPTVCGDGERLKESIYYLIHNAIKFNKIGGAVEVTCDLQRNAIRVSVSDTGVGVPPERLPSIWDGFNLSLNGKGRPGMGLALTRFIVQAHGGRVAAASQYGTGSVFSFFLPVYDPAVVSPEL